MEWLIIDSCAVMVFDRCVTAKGEDAPECNKFAKYYRSLCPSEWVCDLFILFLELKLICPILYSLVLEKPFGLGGGNGLQFRLDRLRLLVTRRGGLRPGPSRCPLEAARRGPGETPRCGPGSAARSGSPASSALRRPSYSPSRGARIYTPCRRPCCQVARSLPSRTADLRPRVVVHYQIPRRRSHLPASV
ncbi:hypothetical protein ZIOFF_026747 [Zingiber officinale]|uniref:Uncharacterized protein n=1 Tax=Zingiber officinale TaxID=94328 RepID=A0A8J5GZV5_ZINOF|nr:hypothetical protein ZIOFF_026747 [Zingiber officinale]